jgi:hypothetical protein
MKAKRVATVCTLSVALPLSALLAALPLCSVRAADAAAPDPWPKQVDDALACLPDIGLTTSYERPAQAGYVAVQGSDGTSRFVASVRSDPMSFVTECDGTLHDVLPNSVDNKCLSKPQHIFLTNGLRFRIHNTKANVFSLTFFDRNGQPIDVGGESQLTLEPVHLTGWWGKEGFGWLATPSSPASYWKFFVYLQPKYDKGTPGPEKNYRIEYFEGDLCKDHIPSPSLSIRSNYPDVDPISADQGGVGNGGEPPPRH